MLFPPSTRMFITPSSLWTINPLPRIHTINSGMELPSTSPWPKLMFWRSWNTLSQPGRTITIGRNNRLMLPLLWLRSRVKTSSGVSVDGLISHRLFQRSKLLDWQSWSSILLSSEVMVSTLIGNTWVRILPKLINLERPWPVSCSRPVNHLMLLDWLTQRSVIPRDSMPSGTMTLVQLDSKSSLPMEKDFLSIRKWKLRLENL